MTFSVSRNRALYGIGADFCILKLKKGFSLTGDYLYELIILPSCINVSRFADKQDDSRRVRAFCRGERRTHGGPVQSDGQGPQR